jgi:hypothetical protein
MQCEGDGGVALCVIANPFTLGYALQTAAQAMLSRIGIANLTNLANRSVAASAGTVQAAMGAAIPQLVDGVSQSQGRAAFVESIVDPPENVPSAYPISMFSYLMFDAARLKCDRLHDVIFLIYWAWTNSNAAQIALAHGSIPISEAVSRSLVPQLLRIRCQEPSISPLTQLLTQLTTCETGAGPAGLPHSHPRFLVMGTCARV